LQLKINGWVASVYLSKKQYLALPDNPPDCFVVTAALRGHQTVVGPLVSVNRYNEERTANHQLITFWNFESLWQKRSPRTHRRFRIIYNRIGPILAAGIKNKFVADIVYLLIRPCELIAGVLVTICRNSDD